MNLNPQTTYKKRKISLLTKSVLFETFSLMSAMASGIFLQEDVVANSGTLGAGEGI